MSSQAIASMCKSFTAILKLKLLEQYNDKYNDIIMHHCDALIVMFQSKEEDQLHNIIRMNCESLRAALEYKINLNSVYYAATPVKYTQTQMQYFKDALEKHLNHFDVCIEPYNVTYLRFDALVKCNCNAIKELFNANVSDGFIEWYNVLIKFISHALYEILVWRMARRYHIRFDVLMKLNARALKEVLELKITAMESTEEYDPDDKSRRTEYLLYKMHTGLLQEINNYLQQ